MRPTQKHIAEAVLQLSICRYFPAEPQLARVVAQLLERMVPTVDALVWLIDTMANHIGEWRGPAELRGLLCTRFKPLDGIEANCTLSGFTADDGEARHSQLTADRFHQISGGSPMGPEELEQFHRKILGPAIKQWPQ